MAPKKLTPILRLWCSLQSGQWLRVAHDDVQRPLSSRDCALLVWALDRRSREGPLATLEIVHRLGRYGVQVLSL